ncbi:alpha/beta-hydrolase [Schizophyllum commune H4-8]|uniref:alpha/beta-hydrolase n=1 Tax=Schizophyllum commune (strain H4-8 / FGSC 9210) TaxID=578458 RepID=UPI00215FD62D|nr:alpha/beta-hydrolase [Schizophyllum commune H4-8]KAI5900467.1 alpha/beta-hydrolase [Schizophyllum commune H4-8]
MPPAAFYPLRDEDAESYIITDGLKVIERFFTLPLDYGNPEGLKIRVFARNLFSIDQAKTPEEQAALPYLVYLQGGPGFECDVLTVSGMASELHSRGYQTLWLDQRGTGLSTPLSAEVLQGKSDKEIAEYCKHFRADNIVRDCEAIREALIGHKDDPEQRKWTILGQSFGGFCAFTYLSFFPDSLKEVFTTGGIPPLLLDDPVANYEATAKQVAERNKIYYEKYPQDIKRVRQILRYLEANNITLPSGGRLSVQRFQALGIAFGAKNGIDTIHQLVLRATNDLEIHGILTYHLLSRVEAGHSFDQNPIYFILHEPIYCSGKPAQWAASRVLKNKPQFLWAEQKDKEDQPVYFTGEMIFPEMLDDFVNLRPLKGAAHLLAEKADWPALYDRERLSKNKVKVTSATYFTDMYVPFDLVQEVVAAVPNVEQWITNQHFHSAVRQDPKGVFDMLFRLSKRERD